MSFKAFSALFLGAALATTGVFAADFSKNSKAKKWGLTGEEKATFSGKVVDVMCELSGDCADNCGNGNRYLGIVREADNQLVYVLKNRQTAFNGPVVDLLPYCNKQVDVDGVLVGEDDVVKAKFYLVQLIREKGAAEWNKTTLWIKDWAKKHPDAKGKGAWFRRDPRVAKQIAKEGHFGLGHEADAQYLKENE